VSDREERLRVDEAALRRAGLPTLIEDYSASEDIFNRAVGFFATVYLLEVANALKADYGWWNLAAFVGGVALAVVSFGFVNLARGRRFLSIPTQVGPPELAAFVLLPGLLPLVFGLQWRSALVTVAVNLFLVGAVWVMVGFGVFPILRWVGARSLVQLRTSVQLLVRAVPILIFFALIVFFASEVWQVFTSITGWRLALGLGLFVIIGALFLGVRVPPMVTQLEEESGLTDASLSRRQRWNVGIIVFLSYGLQVLFVSLAVFVAFMVLGTVLVDASVQATWVGHPVTPVRLGGLEFHLTQELVRVSLGMAAISGLYYAVALVVDPAYRDELVEGLTDEMRSTFALRAEYLALRALGR
jgi:hypothetical protein